ncbi:MAG: hypothetical protein ABGX04_04920 [Myxococcales bacterium]|jgi:hypothetical protein|nr:hypothetical protein [Myxococcales bacterium]HIK86333.1 hypothetical protein [Myxococcales bacterium]
MEMHSPSCDWIEELIAAHADEISAWEIIVRFELDPRFRIVRSLSLERAMTELFVASTRKLASVFSLELGSLTLRWQAAGRERLVPINSASVYPKLFSRRINARSRSQYP